ncbi:unnamed protein product [Schistosoma curassoni]|uniref:CCHC-type domain-containing protein n=1 Tax=Schistosoma curassoni TaxID=6186 RepID=A0A183K942_9TREM|nr:unnamed protein product [Schistosoma curassoni]
MIHQDIKNSTILLCHPDPVHTQGYGDNSLRSCDAVHEDEIKFGKCLFCGKFHSRNPCVFRNSKCFDYGDIGHIQSVCRTTVRSATINAQICNYDPIKLDVFYDHLFSLTTLKNGKESYSRTELNKTQNPCETTVSNQSTYQISHFIVLDTVFPNDSHISDEIPYKSEENMLSEPNRDQKPYVVLIDADISNDPLLCNDILNNVRELFQKNQILMTY